MTLNAEITHAASSSPRMLTILATGSQTHKAAANARISALTCESHRESTSKRTFCSRAPDRFGLSASVDLCLARHEQVPQVGQPQFLLGHRLYAHRLKDGGLVEQETLAEPR